MSVSRREPLHDIRRREVPLFPPKRGGALRVALCFPNDYRVGMSNLGFHSVYRLFNAEEDVLCERVFLPSRDESLRSLESGTDARGFDVLAFSISFESDAPNVLRMLRLAGMRLRAAERGARDPLVVLGGAAMIINPEPLALFADVIAVGEGEVLVPRLVQTLREADTTRSAVERLSASDGFYVPVRHDFRFADNGSVQRIDGPGPVARQRALPAVQPVPQSTVLTPHTEMPMKLLVETTRGCPCFCRFCWAGYGFLPVRHVPREAVVDIARQARAATAQIGLVATAVCAHPEIEAIVADLKALDYCVSVSSLRLDDLTPRFVSLLGEVGLESVALAPECGADRLRRVLNKAFTNDEICEKAAWLGASGLRSLKLYFMVGLPDEEEADINAILTLTKRIRDAFARGRQARGARIQVSVNPYIPKPGTPFARVPLADPKRTAEKLQHLRRGFERLSGVKASFKSMRAALEQAVLSLGDRRLADVLVTADREGQGLLAAMKAHGMNERLFVARDPADAGLRPWDVIECSVSARFLQNEYERSREDQITPHCDSRATCRRCGVCHG